MIGSFRRFGIDYPFQLQGLSCPATSVPINKSCVRSYKIEDIYTAEIA